MITERDILTLDLESIWTLFKINFNDMSSGYDENGDPIDPIVTKNDYNKVRFGFEIEFEIDDYFENIFRYKFKSKTIVIHKKNFWLKDFRTEMERREVIMRKALMQFYSQDVDNIKRLR